MAAIFSGLSSPLYRRLLSWVRGRRALAAILTLLTLLILVVLPLAGFMGVVAAEAVSISQSVSPWVREHLREPGQLGRLLERVPFLAQLQEQVQVYSAQIIEKLGELAGMVSSLLVNSLSAATKGTVGFLFQLFVMIYAMFFFLVGGRAILDKALVYVPLPEADKELLVDKFVSVARATLKGTFVVGLVQGGLAGLAFAVVGIHGSAFWGTIMVVLSIIPGIGTALIWVPAVIYLFAVGKTTAAVGLAVWCALVVGTVDNFLRPKLVGADTKMPDLLILLSTFGGLSMFGAVGLVLGPIIAAVFIAVWKIYGEAFEDLLRADSSPDGGGSPTS
jgi:predicted PurR-regulated permease PerM